MKKLMIASLVLASFSALASETCEHYFKAIDSYLDRVASVEAMKPQIETIKSQYQQSKKQIDSLPAKEKESTCQQGLDALKMAEQQMKLMQP